MSGFYYEERVLPGETINNIDYYAGPVKISICCWAEEIYLEVNEKWENSLKECLETAKKAWCLKDEQIKIEGHKATISFDYNNLKHYIEHRITYY